MTCIRRYEKNCAHVNTNRSFYTAAILPFFLVILFTGFCKKNPAPQVELQGQALGAKFNVKYIQEKTKLNDEVAAKYLKNFFIDLQNKTSLYQEDSELIRINNAPAGQWMKISEPLGFMITYAQMLSGKTGGYYDITTGSLSKLWALDNLMKVEYSVPLESEIAAARIRTGYDKIRISHGEDGYRMYKSQPGIIIDLASLAAGYAADQIAGYLESHGVKNYIIDVGGEFRAAGTNAGNIWTIGIENPVTDYDHQPDGVEAKTQKSIIAKVLLPDVSMATSGNYKNFVKKQKMMYSHIMDPHTGKPSLGNLVSISVIQDKCMEADALATGLFAMGADKAEAYARQNHIAILMIVMTKGGKPELRFSPEMNKYLEK